MTEPDALDALCRERGLRLTTSRRALLAVLRQVEVPCDAPELLRRAQRHADLRLGTVYRFLRELERHELVHAEPQPHGRLRWCLRSHPAAGADPGESDALIAPMRAFLRELEALGLADQAFPAALPGGPPDATLQLLQRVAARLGYRLAPMPSPAY